MLQQLFNFAVSFILTVLLITGCCPCLVSTTVCPNSLLNFVSLFDACGYGKCESGSKCHICVPWGSEVSRANWPRAAILARALANADPHTELVRLAMDKLLDECRHPTRANLENSSGRKLQLQRRNAALACWLDELQSAYRLGAVYDSHRSRHLRPGDSLMSSELEPDPGLRSTYGRVLLDYLRRRLPTEFRKALDNAKTPKNSNTGNEKPSTSLKAKAEDLLGELHVPLMRPLTEEEHKVGHIYILRPSQDYLEVNFPSERDRHQIVKIGVTGRSINTRVQEISDKCKTGTEVLYGSPEVSYAWRTEHMIHHCLKLGSGRQVKPKKCVGCKATHTEFFRISSSRAEKLVQRWCAWMNTHKPYEVAHRFGLTDLRQILLKVSDFIDSEEVKTVTEGKDDYTGVVDKSPVVITSKAEGMGPSASAADEGDPVIVTSVTTSSSSTAGKVRIPVTPAPRRVSHFHEQHVYSPDGGVDSESPPTLVYGDSPSPACTPEGPDTPTPSLAGRGSSMSYSTWSGLSSSSDGKGIPSDGDDPFAIKREEEEWEGREEEQEYPVKEHRRKLVSTSRRRNPLVEVSN